MSYHRINTITGWGVFVLAALVYLFTMERTASFWDCGEFIAAANKLQVVHPPGAPLYLLIGRLFSSFVPPDKVALALNILSAISTAFAAMFVYWSITILAKRIFHNVSDSLAQSQIVAVIGSGIIGASAFIFSDSQWFNAVEAEVYALSTMLTALVFWMALKWSEHAKETGADRWLLGIAYVIGLSIGVHLLNLLAIPAIALLVYFYRKKKPFNWKSAAIAFLIGCFTLLFIQVGIIQWLPKIASTFELTFVNSLKLPFGSGLLFFMALVGAVITYFLIYSKRKGNVFLNKALLGIVFVLIGYMSYALVLIRSNANTPIDINNPDNVFNLLSYLNREQYGSRPLVYGQTYASDVKRINGVPVTKTIGDIYKKKNKKYEDIGDKMAYDHENKMLFPRAWNSNDDNDIAFYKNWMGIKSNRAPSFFENVRFFYTYQLDFMYWRYFMWNFAGRQNDIQGHGDAANGNWQSGLAFADNGRVVNAKQLPDYIKRSKGRNFFYLLPFVLGIIGMVFHFKYHKEDAIVLGTLFLLTGVAIVIYLNQDPFQPRERDYAYAGSFLAFAIWIGLGAVNLLKLAQEKGWEKFLNNTIWFAVGISTFVVLGLCANNFSTLFGVLMTSVLLFALFYMIAFGVQHLKSNFSQSVLLVVLLFFVPLLMAINGWDDHDRSQHKFATATGKNYLNSIAPNAILFTEGDNDTYPLWYAQEVERVRSDVRLVNNSLLKGDWYADQIQQHNGYQAGLNLSFPPESYMGDSREAIYYQQIEGINQLSLDQILGLIRSDDPRTKVRVSANELIDFFPTKNIILPIEKEDQLANNIVSVAQADEMDDSIQFTIPKNLIIRDEWLIYDLINTYINERPIFFTGQTLPKNLGLSPYIWQEGASFRLLPVRNPEADSSYFNSYNVPMNSAPTYHFLTTSVDFGNINSGTHLTETGRRQLIRTLDYVSLCITTLADENEKEKALEVYALLQTELLNTSLSFDDPQILLRMGNVVHALYKIGETEKATSLSNRVADGTIQNLKFYSTNKRFNIDNKGAMIQNMRFLLSNVMRAAATNGNDTLFDELDTKYKQYRDEFGND